MKPLAVVKTLSSGMYGWIFVSWIGQPSRTSSSRIDAPPRGVATRGRQLELRVLRVLCGRWWSCWFVRSRWIERFSGRQRLGRIARDRWRRRYNWRAAPRLTGGQHSHTDRHTDPRDYSRRAPQPTLESLALHAKILPALSANKSKASALPKALITRQTSGVVPVLAHPKNRPYSPRPQPFRRRRQRSSAGRAAHS